MKRFTDKIGKMPITIMILVANIVAFLMCVMRGGDAFATGGLNYKYVVLNHEYVRCITYMFMHANLMHIVSNMFALVLFADEIEPKLGTLRMAIIYIGSGVLGGIFTMIVHYRMAPDVMNYSVGASAAVYGIMCTLFILRYREEEKTRPDDLLRAIGTIVIYSAITFKSGVDIWGHIGGGIAGGVLAYILTVKRWERFSENAGLKIVGVLICINVCVVGVCAANIGGKPNPLPDARVDYMKAQSVSGRDVTYGELFERSCRELCWEAFESTDGQDVVEVTGIVYYERNEHDLRVQFVLNGNNAGYTMWFVSLDGQALSRSKMIEMFNEL